MSGTATAAIGRRQSATAAALAAIVLAGLVGAALLEVGLGPRQIPVGTILAAVFHYDAGNFEHLVVVNLRLPRMVGAVLVGAALGLSGATVQAATRNPLAGPDILGMNAGASLAVVATLVLTGTAVIGAGRPLVASLGAATAFFLVTLISSAGRGGPTPIKVALTGIAVSAFAGAIISAILVLDESSLEIFRTWLAGSLSGQRFDVIAHSVIPMAIGAALALALGPRLNAMALGDESAKGLGVEVRSTRYASLIAAALLAGGAVSMTGPIGFVGLVAPHIVKLFVPHDNRLILPLSAGTGALMLVLADLCGRLVLAPQEVATGIITAIVGAPVFMLLVRSRL